MANTKKSRGLATTGVGTVDCARHNMKLHNAAGDLQKRENEAPEHGWANINPIASSTKEMGPGSWHNTLNDHFSDWNWKCVVQLGQLTARKLANAVEKKADHQCKLLELESCLKTQDISEWRIDIEAWELDRMQPNPFKVQVAHMFFSETQATVQLELTHIKAAELESGTNISLHADVPPSVLITSTIDLEDQQCHLSHELAALSAHPTDHQLAKVLQHANVLHRKINVWQDIQLLYMPFVSCLWANEDCPCSPTDATPAVKAINLWLPSGVSLHTQCSTQLYHFEWMLWYAQANDVLRDIHNLLRLCSHLYKFKDNHIISQAPNTHTRSTINKTNIKVSMATEHYEVARVALTTLVQILDEDPAWKDIFKPLNCNKDLKLLKDMWEKEMEGTRHLSWIWKTLGVAEDTSVGLHDALHIE
ncbi:hypothetical protein BD769DRAFT_1669671 [Suillus cothurnatus]|nr:hypothetical protein BD769DRAFT_1669671 [Suillus cothurnatus]